MRSILIAITLLGVAAPLAAQSQRARQSDPDIKAAGGGQLPPGWRMRLDRANAKPEDARFVTMGSGFHATSGPAAIYYNPQHMVKGPYTVRASFAQTKPSAHPEAYGVFIGGSDLEGPNQQYVYFLIRQDGKFLIKHRLGAETHNIMDWTDNAAVNKVAEGGGAKNDLSVAVAADSVRFMVNGKQVASFPRSEMKGTDGQAGLRVNHNLDVHIARFEVAKK